MTTDQNIYRRKRLGMVEKYQCLGQKYDEAAQIRTQRCLELDEICVNPAKV